VFISLLINLEKLSKFKKYAYKEFELRMNVIEEKLTDKVFTRIIL